MRTLTLLACALSAAILAASAGAAEPTTGTLSIDQGKGVVMLDLRGSVLGRLGSGSLRVTDHTPRDRFGEIVFGRRISEERVGPRTVVYRGVGLRFRMVGGGYRIVVRGTGIAVSAVGRGVVSLDGDGESPGVYSLSGVDCWVEAVLCTPLPDEPERFVLGPPEEPGETRPLTR